MNIISQGKETTDEDFIWMWSQFQNKSYTKLMAASNGNTPEVILWSSHLTNEANIGNLVKEKLNLHLLRKVKL